MQGYSEEEIEAVLQPLRQRVLHAPDRASLALTRAEEFPDTRLRQRSPRAIPPQLLWGLRQGAARLFKVCAAPHRSGLQHASAALVSCARAQCASCSCSGRHHLSVQRCIQTFICIIFRILDISHELLAGLCEGAAGLSSSEGALTHC